MKLVRLMTLAAIGLGGLGAATAVGCGGSAQENGEGGTDSGHGKDSGGPAMDSGPGIVAPTKPKAPPTTSKTPLNFAIHQLYLGDTDYGGMPGTDKTAWQKMGYNIDGKITTTTSTNVCKLVKGGGSFGLTAQLDGNGGIDNSFGENIYTGILLSVDPTAASTVLDDLNAGDFTLMFDVTGLTSDPKQSATGLTAQAFAGGHFNGTPTWSPSDNWPILGGSGLLMNSTPPFKSDIQFSDSYVVNGTWVSGSPSTISLNLSISGVTLSLSIGQAVITFDHTSNDHGGNGVVSGVLKTSDLVTAIKGIAGRLAPSLCTGSALTPIIDEIEEASDIMSEKDSTGSLNPGPSVTCDAISIGLGFQADVIGQPQELAPASCVKADPCSDAAPPVCDSGTPPVDSGSDAGSDAPPG